MGKSNDRNISKTKGLYKKKSILRRENNNQMTIKDNNNFYKGYDSCNLISDLMNKYKKRNMRLPHINSRDKHIFSNKAHYFNQGPFLITIIFCIENNQLSIILINTLRIF